ncbi:MAG TPA: DUF3419 family protein [Nannocystaceae bacterium]|nr:DUF3419 family protein [Nannocystaceae bacterium]
MSWLDDAAALPIAFAQVREDPLLDVEVIARLPEGVRALVIASGGCTAALLSCSPYLASLDLVDPNPAQLVLTRLKLAALADPPARRRACFGHAPMSMEERRAWLRVALDEIGEPHDALGPFDFVAQHGPDHAGRYERLFAALREALAFDELDTALDRVFALPNLVRLFGESATSNPREPFARHFAARIRDAQSRPDAHDNPWLSQLLHGEDPPGNAAPWLDARRSATPPAIRLRRAFVDDALHGGAFDFVHLSNALDWLAPQAAARTLALAADALRPDGLVFVRQLNSTIDVRALGPAFEWLPTDDMLARDRSFFYRELHLGRRR